MNHPFVSAGPALFLSLGVALGACAPDSDESDQNLDALTVSDCPSPMPRVGAAGTSLTPAADQRLWFVLHAVGTQNYVCNAAGNAWTFVGPQANLLNAGGQVVGTHYASAGGATRPAWRYHDGSTVVMARAGGVTVDAASIPWLLLTAVSHEGSGRFAEVSSIQRLNTRGGLAPAGTCTPGAETRVPYETDYFFYKTGEGNPAHNPQCRSVP